MVRSAELLGHVSSRALMITGGWDDPDPTKMATVTRLFSRTFVESVTSCM
jgi:hypothetical protein